MSDTKHYTNSIKNKIQKNVNSENISILQINSEYIRSLQQRPLYLLLPLLLLLTVYYSKGINGA